MLPLFTPPSDADAPSSSRKRAKLAVASTFIGMLVALIFVGVLTALMSGRVDVESFQRTMLPLLVSGLIVAVVFGTVFFAVMKRPETDEQKPKREGMDMYELIDRMVDDLDDDEAAYLQRRLDARESSLRSDLAESAEDLFSRRAEDRRKGLRE